VPLFRPLYAGLSPWRKRLISSPVRAGFVVNKVALRDFFTRVHSFSPVCVIPAVLHFHSSLTDFTESHQMIALLNNPS